MTRPSSEFLRTPRSLRLIGFVFILILAMALTVSTDSWSQTKKTAPVKKTAAATAKALGWCNHAAPVVNGIATVTISPVGTTTNLKVDYDRVCIGTTDKIVWKWSGDPSKDWYVEFFAGANPFPKNKYGKGSPQSDSPKAAANDYLIYKYRIHVDTYNDLDPDVIIKGG